ncbi:hypothetical protein FISHEDRAFT_77543 [Fistulina hepatica ATCC 64428]|uniref:Transcription factor IIIC 90kDa subunit N-terminal domain-containing protein n=1 Tax=Fistulina hepatica ATCC 64428 TaxID=1128425 RepID=A0A0D7A0U0_9AGAR|nr:hypothetical protein FISHEDRAFT_77543 [Fistulina hepatica ATCC 64428]
MIDCALTVPTTCVPGTRCLQWSYDGQLVLTARSAIYLMMPADGLPDASDVLNSVPILPGKRTLAWHRTVIPTAPPVAHGWPDSSTPVLGSIDVATSAAAPGPRGLIAALTTNSDLALYRAAGNRYRSAWASVFDVIPLLSDTGNAQVTSIVWTAAPRCLLLAGTRAGTIVFLRPEDSGSENVTLHVQKTLSLATGWITHVACSPWMHDPADCLVAYSVSDGSVGILLLRSGAPYDHVIVPDSGEDLTAHRVIYAPDGRSITSLEWVVASGEPVLVFTKPGIIGVWPGKCQDFSGNEFERVMKFKSGTWHPCTGVVYLKTSDSLILSFFDARLRVIRNISWIHLADADFLTVDDLLSSRLTETLRAAVDTVERRGLPANSSRSSKDVSESSPGDVSFSPSAVPRLAGFASYNGDLTLVWAYEMTRPNDFSYLHDAQQTTTLVVATFDIDMDETRLFASNVPSDDAAAIDLSPSTQVGTSSLEDRRRSSYNKPVVDNLREIQRTVQSAHMVAPLCYLRPVFYALRDPAAMAHVWDDLLAFLREPFKELPDTMPEPDEPLKFPAPSGPAEAQIAEVGSVFRRCVERNLCDSDTLFVMRLRYSLADFAWKNAPNPAARDACGLVALTLRHSISANVLRLLIRLVHQVRPWITASERAFIHRLMLQASLDNSPPELQAEGATLEDLLVPKGVESIDPALVASSLPNTAVEACPACKEPVPLEDIAVASCPKGHTWSNEMLSDDIHFDQSTYSDVHRLQPQGTFAPFRGWAETTDEG